MERDIANQAKVRSVEGSDSLHSSVGVSLLDHCRRMDRGGAGPTPSKQEIQRRNMSFYERQHSVTSNVTVEVIAIISLSGIEEVALVERGC
jgi:hypothetical protein